MPASTPALNFCHIYLVTSISMIDPSRFWETEHKCSGSSLQLTEPLHRDSTVETILPPVTSAQPLKCRNTKDKEVTYV